MKRILCCALALLLCACACAEPIYDTVRVAFEDGFSLSLPADWVSYEVPTELADSGFLYCLGSADGARLLYIQRWATQLDSTEAIKAMLAENPDVVVRPAAQTSSGHEFVMYSFAESDASGCMTLYNDSLLNLLFSPQSDPENMLIAATVLESFGE